MFPAIKYELGHMPKHNMLVLSFSDELPGMKFEVILTIEGARLLAESLNKVADKHSAKKKAK